MDHTKTAKAIAVDLHRTWQELLDREGLSPELDYRIGKMADRLMPVLDRTYLRSQAGHRAVLQCVEKTERFKTRLDRNGEDLFHVLTDLEKFYEDFLRMAHIYSVNAVSYVAKLKSKPYGSSLILGERP